MKSSNVVLILIILSMCSVSLAQDSKQDFLDEHNKARAEVGVDPLKWNDTLAEYAQKYAESKIKNCELEHSYGLYGENLAGSTGDMSGIDSVKMWVGEKEKFDTKSKKCGDIYDCGHYTQVVWRTTLSVGCAKVKCNNGGTFVICNYFPPGNYPDKSAY